MGTTTPADQPYRGPTIPDALADQLGRIMGLEAPPETFADWVDAMVAVAERDGIDAGLDALCTTDDSPHAAAFGGETRYFQCAQDAIIVPFLLDDVDAVDVRTESPVSGERISIAVDDASVAVEPAGAVMSFGVAREVDPPAGGEPGPIQAYRYVCPYGNAFASRAEYRSWSAAVDAHTMPVSVADTVEFARAIGRAARGAP